MAVVEFMNNSYSGRECIENLIFYATHKKNGDWLMYYGGRNIYVPDAVYQMRAVKEFFRKSDGFRQVRHIVISFEDREQFTPFEASVLADRFCDYYADRYQIVYGVHEDTDNLHIHMVFNTTSFADGRLYSDGIKDLSNFRQYVSKVIRDYSTGNSFSQLFKF